MNNIQLTVDDLGIFRANLIREYRFFFLFTNPDQRLIGRCYAWLKRPGDMQDMADLSMDEHLELHSIQKGWSRTMRDLFGMTLPHYAWLGAEIQTHKGHGHLHMIPRYDHGVTFTHEEFADVNFEKDWGRIYNSGNPPKRPLSADQMKKLISLIRVRL